MSAPFPHAWVGVTPSHPPHTGQWWGAWPFEEEAEDGEGLREVRRRVLPEAPVLQEGQGQHRCLTGPHPAGTCPTLLSPHTVPPQTSEAQLEPHCCTLTLTHLQSTSSLCCCPRHAGPRSGSQAGLRQTGGLARELEVQSVMLLYISETWRSSSNS